MPDATTSLAVLVAETDFITSSAELLLAEQRSCAASLSVAPAATATLPIASAVLLAGQSSQTTELDLLLDGSFYLQASARLAIAAAMDETADLSCTVAEILTVTSDVEVAVTDAATILVEPDRPRAAPLLVLTDLYLSVHPNAITSPTTDFVAAGVAVGDVLEVTEGPDAGHYLIRALAANELFVHEAFPVREAGPLPGEVRVRRDRFATVTAAVVLDQALFVAGVTVSASLDMVLA